MNVSFKFTVLPGNACRPHVDRIVEVKRNVPSHAVAEWPGGTLVRLNSRGNPAVSDVELARSLRPGVLGHAYVKGLVPET